MSAPLFWRVPAASLRVGDWVAVDLDAIVARERATLDAVRERLRCERLDPAGVAALTREERRADDALRLVAALRAERAEVERLRAQLAAQAPTVALDALRNRHFAVRCCVCSAEWPPDARDCPGCGHPDRAAGAVPAGFDDLFAAPPAEDDTDATQLAALAAGERSSARRAGEAFAAQHPHAAGAIMGGVAHRSEVAK